MYSPEAQGDLDIHREMNRGTIDGEIIRELKKDNSGTSDNKGTIDEEIIEEQETFRRYFQEERGDLFSTRDHQEIY